MIFKEGTEVFEAVAAQLDKHYLELDELGYDLAELDYIEMGETGFWAHFDINTMEPLELTIHAGEAE